MLAGLTEALRPGLQDGGGAGQSPTSASRGGLAAARVTLARHAQHVGKVITKAFRRCGIAPRNPQAVLTDLQATVVAASSVAAATAAADAAGAAGASAAVPAATAAPAAAAAALEADVDGSSSKIAETELQHALAVLQRSGANGTVAAAAAAAVLRGEQLLQKRKHGRRISGWITATGFELEKKREANKEAS